MILNSLASRGIEFIPEDAANFGECVGDCQPRTVFCEESGKFCRFPVSGSLLADSTIHQPMQVLREEMYYVLKTYLWIILGFLNPSNSQDLIINSLLELLCISL